MVGGECSLDERACGKIAQDTHIELFMLLLWAAARKLRYCGMYEVIPSSDVKLQATYIAFTQARLRLFMISTKHANFSIGFSCILHGIESSCPPKHRRWLSPLDTWLGKTRDYPRQKTIQELLTISNWWFTRKRGTAMSTWPKCFFNWLGCWKVHLMSSVTDFTGAAPRQAEVAYWLLTISTVTL